jgi:ABC-type sugar transport system substrate-binding protein
VNTDYTLRDAEQKMTDTLQAKGEVDGVFGGNDDVALGAIRAMVSAGYDPSKKVVIGVDGTQAALTAICKGQMYQTMATFPKAEAKLVIDTAKKIKAGKSVPKNVLFPAIAVNRGNLTEMAKEAGVTLSGCVK